MSARRLKYWERRMLSHPRGKLYQLVKRSAWCEQQLELLVSLTSRLLEDEHLIALLQAEGLKVLPTYLSDHVAALRKARQERGYEAVDS